jgi:cell division protease FtsH
LPHLDLLTTTTKSGLTDLAKETLAWIHESPDVTLLGFKDPAFEVPKPVEDVFTVKESIIGLRRDAIGALLLRREARKFTADVLNPYRFYKYVSGLNALRFRRLMRAFDTAPDFDPARPETAEALYRQLRAMTLLADFEMPNVDLERDVAGYAGVKQALRDDILALLARRDQATEEHEAAAIEDTIPKGLIFHGPPGTGKTWFAKALATALDATITVVNGPELKERWVGASEENLRRIFAQARKSAPSIIVFDELDSIAARRGMYFGSGVEHSLVNQLLTEMDGFRSNELVFVVGTTNFLAALDPALLRPGRFELQLELPYPDETDRRAIIDLYRARFGLDLPDDVRDYLVERTADFVDAERQIRYSGDHLHAVCRALRRRAIRDGAFTVTRRHLDEALARPRPHTPVVSPSELRTVAWHEAGHALCAQMLPDTPDVRKVSIQPGELNLPVLGMMLQQARENQHIVTREELLAHMAVSLGGRLAEELALGVVSNGAHNDLVQASQVARAMVEELGMGPGVGNQAVLLPTADGSRRRDIGGGLAAAVDQDVEALLRAAETKAREVLTARLPLLNRLAELLLAHQTLEDEALAAVWSG